MNPSQAHDRRFYRRWSRSGALGDINGPYPSNKQILRQLSDQNYQHMVQMSEIYYILEWLPKEILEAEGIAFQSPYDIRPFVVLTLFETIMENPKYMDMLPEGMFCSMDTLLQEVDKDGFRTADDYPPKSVGEIQ